MPQLPSSFNASEHEGMKDFSAIPLGDYPAEIVNSEVKDSKNKPQNKYWKLEFQITEGDYKGRKLWKNLNLINDNPQAVEIAQRELTSICEACGLVVIGSTEELHKIPMIISVKVTPATAQYAEGNDITKYSIDERFAKPAPSAPAATKAAPAKPAPAATGAAAASSAAAPAKKKKPWEV